MNNEPPSRHRGQLDPIRRTISNSPRTRSPSQRREDKDFEFGETEDSDSVPESVVHKPPARQHHRASERCRNNARGSCHASSCTRWHAKFDDQATESCLDHETPGIWCERAYEIYGPGCPFRHVMPKDADTTRRTKGLSSSRQPSAHATEDDRQLKPCWYYQQPSGCKKGDNCNRSHDPAKPIN